MSHSAVAARAAADEIVAVVAAFAGAATEAGKTGSDSAAVAVWKTAVHEGVSQPWVEESRSLWMFLPMNLWDCHPSVLSNGEREILLLLLLLLLLRGLQVEVGVTAGASKFGWG